MSAAAPPVFVLGVGAQKGGTTWLHRYIAQAPGTDTGRLKEYHVWDARYLPDCARFRVPLWQVPHPKAWLRWRMQRSDAAYFDYFARRLARPGVHLTADITPSYSGLPTEALARIAEGFAARGIAVRVVFLMRDPVQRCWSAIRMTRRQGKPQGGTAQDLSEEQALEAHAFGAYAGLRTRYDLTLARLEQVFAPEALHVGLYETLFQPDSLARLSGFLGLPPDPDFARHRFNVSDKTAPVSSDLQARIARHYADVYRDCARRFPGIEAHWPGFAHL